MFDYATKYASQHKTIQPAAGFALSKEEFNQFAKWLEDKDYSYKSETEEMLDSLRQIATREKYFDAIKADYAQLQSKVSHDKKQDLLKHQEEITRFLESEIVSRYYFLRGRIENSLRNDNDVKKAVTLIDQPTQYQALLQPRKTQ